MLTAHMDEIALMVSQVEKGFLRVTQVGGFDPRVLLAQEVIVHGARELPGLVVSVPPHFTDAADREKPVPLEKLFVDVGLPPSDVESLVRVGDLVTLRARWTELSGGYAACKSMDDRAAVAAIVLCLEELSRRTPRLGRVRGCHRAGGGREPRRHGRRLRRGAGRRHCPRRHVRHAGRAFAGRGGEDGRRGRPSRWARTSTPGCSTGSSKRRRPSSSPTRWSPSPRKAGPTPGTSR